MSNCRLDFDSDDSLIDRSYLPTCSKRKTNSSEAVSVRRKNKPLQNETSSDFKDKIKMIIQRQLQSENKSLMQKFHDSGMEFKPIYNKMNTSRENDNLLKPIHRSNHVDEMNGQQSQSLKERSERNLWRNEEVMEMLYTMQQVKALEKLNDKTVKSENVFKDVEVIMHKNGFVKKSHVQIWTKWKFLKSTYMTSRRNGVIPRIVAPQVYEMIHQMITNLNQSLADSCSSLDGDNSSVSGMLISGVECAVNNEADEEDSLGMAHPIFGFRLGTIKPEPEDTGYEPNDNNGCDKDPLEEELSPTKADKEYKTKQNAAEVKTNKEPQAVQKVLEVPPRGRGRPPKNPPVATSTPKNTPSPASMPPLRVAPFAKDMQYQNSAANRPPPPLTMPPTPRIRVANFSNLKDDSLKFTQPKLTPKPLHPQQSPPVQTVRTTKETTAQTRSSSTPSPSYPKMKQIPMRKTPYSLRPDRAIPDLEASLSPPPTPAIDRLSNKKLEEVPSTKHLIMQSSSNNFPNTIYRKRRNDWQDPIPAKLSKFNNSMEEEANNSKSLNIEYDKNYGKVLQNVIIDLSSSLRKMQTDVMRDFFNKQTELLEREHKFQRQQDQMIMKTFQEQTQEILHSVKQLVGSITGSKNRQQYVQKESRKQTKPVRMRQMQAREHEIEADDENEIEDEEEQIQNQEVDNEIEQDATDTLTDDEQEQNQPEEQDDNDEEEEIQNSASEVENEDNEDNFVSANQSKNLKRVHSKRLNGD